MIEEIFGVHEYIKDTCRRLAKAGYLAVAPELYARLADLSKMTDSAQIFRDVIREQPDAQMLSDLDATAAWAAQNRGRRRAGSESPASAGAAAIPGCTRRITRT